MSARHRHAKERIRFWQWALPHLGECLRWAGLLSEAARRGPIAEPLGFDLDAKQQARLGVRDVTSHDDLKVGCDVRVTCDGMWRGRCGTVDRIQVDDSGEHRAVNVLVILRGPATPVVFGHAALEVIP